MADVKWIKIVTDIFDDDKIKLIEGLPDGDSIIVCWFKILCLAGMKNSSGVLMLTERIAYTDEMLSTVFRRPLQTVRLALETFEAFGMIEIVNGAITIPNWGKHQSQDRLEKLKEYQKEYQREYRKKQAQIPEKASEVDRKLYVNTPDKDIEEDKKKKKNISFIPPTVDEIRAYCEEKGYDIDAEYFWNYYNSSNWTRKNGDPVLNWKQTVITWAKKDQEKPKRNKVTTAANYKPPQAIDTSLLDKIKGAIPVDQ